MFYTTKFHPVDLYATVDGERISFCVEVINELYGLSNEAEYLGHELINHLTEGITKEIFKTIMWTSAEWEKMPNVRLQLYPH